jgi:hypothetical protein
MVMTEAERDNIFSSGPARFQLLSAYHSGITGRFVGNFGSKLLYEIKYDKNVFLVLFC